MMRNRLKKYGANFSLFPICPPKPKKPTSDIRYRDTFHFINAQIELLLEDKKEDKKQDCSFIPDYSSDDLKAVLEENLSAFENTHGITNLIASYINPEEIVCHKNLSHILKIHAQSKELLFYANQFNAQIELKEPKNLFGTLSKAFFYKKLPLAELIRQRVKDEWIVANKTDQQNKTNYHRLVVVERLLLAAYYDLATPILKEYIPIHEYNDSQFKQKYLQLLAANLHDRGAKWAQKYGSWEKAVTPNARVCRKQFMSIFKSIGNAVGLGVLGVAAFKLASSSAPKSHSI